MGEKSYTVYEPARTPDETLARADNLVFVKDGFGWLAMLAPAIWLIWYRMWWPLAGYVGAVLLLTLLVGLLGVESEGGKSAVMMGLNVGFGFLANDLRRFWLERGGHRLIGAVVGESEQDCERRFYAGWQPLQQRILVDRGEGRAFS